MTIRTDNLKKSTVNCQPISFDFSQTMNFDDENDDAGSWHLADKIRDAEANPDCDDCEGTGCSLCGDNDAPDAWMPMMNFAYPIDDLELPENWRECLINMTAVVIKGEAYLALTGGGMDMSWEIAETFIRLGYQPPACVAELPAMADRGKSEKDQQIIRACMMTFSVRIGQDMRARARLTEQFLG